MDQRELRDRMGAAMNNGKPGWNDDEPAVVEAAFENVVRDYFGIEYDVRSITSLVSQMRSQVHSVKPPDQLATEAVIRAALGEADVVISDIASGPKFHMRVTVLGYLKVQRGSDEAAVDQLIVEAERVAFERGWKPPLAS